jgi:N-acetylglutamate synthase/N-acetylornithine aminotransferase
LIEKAKTSLLQESQKNKKKKKKKKNTKKERRINGDVEIHSGSNEEHAGSSSIHYEYIPRVVNSEREY